MTRFAFATLAAVLAAGSAFTSAQQRAASAFPLGALQWRSVGPARGGRSIAAAGSPSRPFEYYFGATGGGLWKTTDGGNTWAPVTDGQIDRKSTRLNSSHG